ncbi:MAG: hypothetical protein ABSG46_14110 [Candidatus Binataceae bacterium]
MGDNWRGKFALSFLMLIFMPALAWPGEIPDPCKLLSQSDLSSTLGLADSVVIQPAAVAPPVAAARLVDRGAGNIGLAIPVSSGPRTNSLICEGRAGSVKFTIGVTSVPQAEADEEDDRQQLTLLQKRLALKVEQLTYGNTTCKELLAPAADLLGREQQPNNTEVKSLRCYMNRNGWRVTIMAIPWTLEQGPPFNSDKLHRLTELAAQHLPSVPPSSAQNIATEDAGVPTGFMQ